MIQDKIPPYDIDSEKAILGSLMVDSDCMHEISNLLKDYHFFAEENKTIFKACWAIFSRGDAIDQITVARELKSINKLESVGGNAYLNHCCMEVVTTLHILHYAKIVKDLAIQRKMITIGHKVMTLGYEEKSPSKLMSEFEKYHLELMQEVSTPALLSPNNTFDVAGDWFGSLRVNKHPGVTLGIKELDDGLGGLFGGELTFIAARPGFGKTSLMLDMAKYIGARYGNVAMFSLEQNWKQIIGKLISQDLKIAPRKLRIGNYSDELMGDIITSLGKVMEYNLHFYDTGNVNIGETAKVHTIYSLSHNLKMAYGLSAVMIDYLHLIDDESRFSEVERISFISRKLKRMSEDLDVPIICLCQLNRAPEGRIDHKPQLSDLRSSGSIEQDADTVLMLYRADKYDEELEKARETGRDINGLLEIIIRKHRPDGECTDRNVFLNWNKEKHCYYDIPHKVVKETPEQMR